MGKIRWLSQPFVVLHSNGVWCVKNGETVVGEYPSLQEAENCLLNPWSSASTHPPLHHSGRDGETEETNEAAEPWEETGRSEQLSDGVEHDLPSNVIQLSFEREC